MDSKLQTEILSSEEMISNSLQENNIFLLKSIIYHNPEAIETIASNSNFNLLDNGEKSDLIDYSISVATTNGSSFEDKKEIFAELIKQNPENLNLILNNNHFQQVHDTVKADLLSNEECISAIIESDRLELLKYQVSQDSSILETLATNDAYTSLDYEVQKELCSSREFIDAFIEERDLISLTNLIETDVSISDRIFSSEKLESLEPSEIEALAKCSEVAYTAQSESLEDFSADIERTEVKDVVADIESKNSIELD